MSIKFKVIERGQPGVTGGGTKQFYASAKVNGEQTLEGLTRSIEKISTVSGADIRAVKVIIAKPVGKHGRLIFIIAAF